MPSGELGGHFCAGNDGGRIVNLRWHPCRLAQLMEAVIFHTWNVAFHMCKMNPHALSVAGYTTKTEENVSFGFSI